MKKVILAYRYFCESFPFFNWCILALLSFGLAYKVSYSLVIFSVLFFVLESVKHTPLKKNILPILVKVFIFFVLLGYGYKVFSKYSEVISPTTGEAHLVISEAKSLTRFGKKVTTYYGTLKSFKTNSLEEKNIPCRIILKKHPPLSLDTEYIVHNLQIEKASQKLCVVKNQKTTTFLPYKKHSLSLVKWRYQLKKDLDKKLKKSLKNKKAYHLLSALALGYSDNQTLNFEFSRLGLQHLLAISGFHFALISLFFGFILRKFFSLPMTSGLLILFMTLFMLYIGNSPSILRAYLTITLYLIGHLLSLKPKAINSLCLSCCILLLYNPQNLLSLGFQLSFSATFGILGLFSLVKNSLNPIVKNRSFDETLTLSYIDKWVYLIIYTFKNSLALNIAVALTTLPLLFYHIGSYPCFSMVYNMIIPFFVSISMITLLIALVFNFYQPLATLCYEFNNFFTKTYLILVAYPPPLFSKPVYLKLSFDLTLCVFTLSLYLAIWDYFKNSLYLNRFDKSLLT